MTGAELSQIGILGAEEAGIKKVIAANESLKASLISNPYGWVLLFIGLIVAGLSTWAEHEKKLKEERIEANKTIIEKYKANIEIINQHEELIKSYNELIQKQKEGEDVTNSLYETTLKLAEAYKVVNSELLSSS